MKIKNEFLELAKKAIENGLSILKKEYVKSTSYTFDTKLKKELKSPIDKIIEKKILKILKETNINILSEEIGIIKSTNKKEDLQWIVDPLDGTANYVRKLGECSISIGLYRGTKPIFGVIGTFPSMKVYFGGKEYNSFCDNHKIKVSKIKKKEKAILCTGFPARYSIKNFNRDKILQEYMNYAKVRMLGSASISLLKIAEGKAEVYFEKDIMIWDIAAAAAIVIGAGGIVKFKKGRFKNSYNLYASNKLIKI